MLCMIANEYLVKSRPSHVTEEKRQKKKNAYEKVAVKKKPVSWKDDKGKKKEESKLQKTQSHQRKCAQIAPQTYMRYPIALSHANTYCTNFRSFFFAIFSMID